ncbi:MAG: YfcE family phosphodiesterase [Peptococcaceae bacterium]|nr:YfcE family phosphodiesterase [Peptococcaceae bacterium]
MKIALASDTHGHFEALAAELLQEKVDRVLFAGDHLRDAWSLARQLHLSIDAVPGNCDLGYAQAPGELLLSIWNRRILLTHGHRYRVKNNLHALFYRGQELRADAVVFGHTHQVCCEAVNDLWLLNPGSASVWYKNQQATYILLHIDEQNFRPEVRYFQG